MLRLDPRLFLLPALVATGCAAHHDPDNEPRTDAVTVHGDRHELFIEHRLLVAGVPTRFVTHVTDAVTGEARREGPITFVLLRADEPPIEVPVSGVARLGIYSPDLTFPGPGPWSVTVRVPWVGGVDEVALPARTVFASDAEAEASPATEAPEGISFLKEQAWRVPVRVERAARRTLVERLRLPAEVEALPSRRAWVTPPLAGTLRPPEGGSIPEPGAHVEAGQVVAVVAPPLAGADLPAFLTSQLQLATQEADARARAERAAAVLEQARRAHARVRELAAENARSRRELEEAESAERVAAVEEAAAARLAASIAELRRGLGADLAQGLPALPLRAPISGAVVAVHAAHGEHVTPARPLLQIVDTTVVEVLARAPEADVARLGEGRTAWAEAPGAPGALTSLTGEGVGRFLYAGSVVDPATRTVALVWEVQNQPAWLRPGQTLDVHVETRRAQEVIAIPISALVAEEARWVVFVQLGGETFERRDVALGVRDGEWVEVRSGVAEGERVVTHGGVAIRLASVSSAIPAHGHAH
ncbi:MAG: efflux RND transporter periplasmic adaptor subunit [Planctomycetes bacterium]|nr:efflux RND transporter periplasmic adaptor subunit [Planctomycetota bacterium]